MWNLARWCSFTRQVSCWVCLGCVQVQCLAPPLRSTFSRLWGRYRQVCRREWSNNSSLITGVQKSFETWWPRIQLLNKCVSMPNANMRTLKSDYLYNFMKSPTFNPPKWFWVVFCQILFLPIFCLARYNI